VSRFRQIDRLARAQVEFWRSVGWMVGAPIVWVSLIWGTWNAATGFGLNKGFLGPYLDLVLGLGSLAIVVNTVAELRGAAVDNLDRSKQQLMEAKVDSSAESVDYLHSSFRLHASILIVLSVWPMFWAFAVTALGWQRHSSERLFVTGPHDIWQIATWALELSCRGMFFDVMEHFELSFTTVKPNTQNWTFMAFSFCYRLYCSVAVLAALINVVSYWRARKAFEQEPPTPPK
jgi:hypothetical protein